jgi:hypothetical protein
MQNGKEEFQSRNMRDMQRGSKGKAEADFVQLSAVGCSVGLGGSIRGKMHRFIEVSRGSV